MKKIKQWAINRMKRNFFIEAVLAEIEQERKKQISQSIKRGMASKKLSTRKLGM